MMLRHAKEDTSRMTLHVTLSFSLGIYVDGRACRHPLPLRIPLAAFNAKPLESSKSA